MERGSQESFHLKKLESKTGIRPKFYLLAAGFIFSMMAGTFAAFEYSQARRAGQKQQIEDLLPEDNTEAATELEDIYPNEMARVRKQIDAGFDPQVAALEAKQRLLAEMRKSYNVEEEGSSNVENESHEIKSQIFSREIGTACLKIMRKISLGKGFDLVSESAIETKEGVVERPDTVLVKDGKETNQVFELDAPESETPLLRIAEHTNGSLEMAFVRHDKQNPKITYSRFVEVYPITVEHGTKFEVRITDDTFEPMPKEEGRNTEDFFEITDRKVETTILIKDDEDIDTIDPEEVAEKIMREYYSGLIK